LEFEKILDRVTTGLVSVDSSTTTINTSRKGHIYLPGLPTLYEPQCAEQLMLWWVNEHSEDFLDKNQIKTSYPYPKSTRNKCDIAFSSDGIWPGAKSSGLPEWAIEIKKIVFVGDNGKNNDYGPSKFISPFLKDRSLAHDVLKLKSEKISRKRAVIGYGFNYNLKSLDDSLLKFPEYAQRIRNAINVCKKAGMPNNELDMLSLLEIADFIIQKQKLTGPVIIREFENAWKHPLGGNGLVFGWELNSN
jgi:hypothetical protein